MKNIKKEKVLAWILIISFVVAFVGLLIFSVSCFVGPTIANIGAIVSIMAALVFGYVVGYMDGFNKSNEKKR
ncbi:MAG: hypothetical protein HFJ58_02385 [Clostridia bacterium]|nr:hypothetical protein [Clostridia bacterium]